MGEAVTYRFVDEPQQSYRFVDEPQKQEQKPLAANAGLANLAATVLGLPVETAKNVYNAGAMAIGVPAMALGGPDWEQTVYKNVPGDIESIKNLLRKTGVAGLNPDNPRPESKTETLAYDLTSRAGMIPGLALPAVGSVVAERTMGPEWAGVGALAPAAGVTAYNAARAPGLARQEAQNAVQDATRRAAQKEGYVLPPSDTGGGYVSRQLQSFGGKAATQQQASAKNQDVTNMLARRELGLPKMAPLTEESLKTLRNKFAAPYREIGKLDKEAAQALEDLKQARFDANAWHKFSKRSGDPAAAQKAGEFDKKVATLEQYLEDIAKQYGRSDLIPELAAARRQIAKTYDVERALNIGTGDVNAKLLGKAMDKGKPLSGGLATAGRFAEAYPKLTVEGAMNPAADINALNPVWMTGLGLGGYSALGPSGALLAGIPLLKGPTRSALLSKPVQKMMEPSYDPALMTPDARAILMQQLLLQQRPRPVEGDHQ